LVKKQIKINKNKMQVILVSNIASLGKIGDIVEVKNGYARNFLIPTKKAISFSQNNQKLFEDRKNDFETENQKSLDIAKDIKQKISGKDIIIIENASDDGRLYGSVSSVNIATKINEMIGSKKLSRANVFLSKPIKEIGLYQVSLNLHPELSFEVRAIVSRSESEVEQLIKAYKKSQNKQEDSSSIAQEALDGNQNEDKEGDASQNKKSRKKDK